MKLKKALKIGAVTTALCLGLSIATLFNSHTNYLHRKIAHNVMSHFGYVSSIDISNMLKKPATYLTAGEYTGFLNRGENISSKLDLNKIYLGLEENNLPVSDCKPPQIKESDKTIFYSIRDYFTDISSVVGPQISGIRSECLEKILNLKEGEEVSYREVSVTWIDHHLAMNFTTVDLNGYTLRFGRDNKGIYTSIFDIWDFEPNGGFFEHNKGSLPVRLGGFILPKLGTPIHFYDRLHWNDYGISEEDIKQAIKDPKRFTAPKDFGGM